MKISDLVEEIYAAAATPDHWQPVLESIASISDAEGSLLFTTSPEGIRWVSTPAISSLVKEWVGSEWVQRNERGRRLIPSREMRFLTDLDGFTHEELDREPFYTEFLRPRGLGWCAGTTVTLPCGGTVVLSIEKAYAKGPVSAQSLQILDTLRPHLVRSVHLAASAARSRVLASMEALQRAGIAAAALRRDGSVVQANASFLESGHLVAVSNAGQVMFNSPAAQRAFRDALPGFANKCRRDATPADSKPIVASSADPGGALVAHLIPFEPFHNDIFLGAAMLLLVPAVGRQQAPSEATLMLLFDLTPAEARVVRRLIGGASVKAIAKAQGVNPNTIRMHLKSVFAKTGVHRQAQLVTLLSRLSINWAGAHTISPGP